jgi:Uncharacterized conserved protein
LIRGVLYRQDNHLPLLSDVMHSTNLLERMQGLLGRQPLRQNQALLLRPCSSVHTFGMSYPIDLLFLSRTWQIIKMIHSLRPCRIAGAFGAGMVIEMRAGTLDKLNLTLGTRLLWEYSSCT